MPKVPKNKEGDMTMIAEPKRRGRPPKSKIKTATSVLPAVAHRPTKRVYVCSPLKGNIEKNMRNAEIYSRFVFDSGFVPVTPHIYFPRFLDDTDKIERAAGQRYGLEEMWRCSQLWVFGLNITDGMRAEIELARQLKIPIKYFDSSMEEI